MAGLRDRVKKETSPTASTVLGLTGNAPARAKYPVNVVFDGEQEEAIRSRAKEYGMGVATYIKMLVVKDLNQG